MRKGKNPNWKSTGQKVNGAVSGIFFNRKHFEADKQLVLYYRDDVEGKETNWGPFNSGAETHINTFTGHKWIVRDEKTKNIEITWVVGKSDGIDGAKGKENFILE